jgi:hypothetical protein
MSDSQRTGHSPFSAVTVTEGVWIAARGIETGVDLSSYARRPKHRDLRMHTSAGLTILRPSDRITRLSSTEYIATADVPAVPDFVVEVFEHVRAMGNRAP